MRLISMRWLVAVGCLIALVGAVAGCGDRDDSSADASPDADDEGPVGQGTLTVLAAASLTDAFDEIAAAFENANPGVSVELTYDGSSSLRDQVLAGAPADVFASADTASVDAVAEADGVAGDPRTFATNELAIAVPAGNDARVMTLEDFGDDSRLVGLCDEQVPCGRFARQALASAGVTPAPDTNEPDVRSLLDKVASGDLDAGIVYVTDVLAAADQVWGIEIPDQHNVAAEYPIATLSTAQNPELAEAFVDFVLSDEGQAVLRSHGFAPPG